MLGPLIQVAARAGYRATHPEPVFEAEKPEERNPELRQKLLQIEDETSSARPILLTLAVLAVLGFIVYLAMHPH